MNDERHRQPVTVDVNVLVRAVAQRDRTEFWSWPSPPPASSNPAADCIGIFNDAEEFSLFLSPHILRNVKRVLTDPDDGYGWPEPDADDYVAVLTEIAEASGGEVLDPTVTVTDCVAGYEDNRILELVLASGSLLLVSSDMSHLVPMSPWRGTPIITPAQFVGRVDGMRRSPRR
ncbi:MAG: hypothetical protein ACYDEY_10720 [Acidimicrobiales bacterium]